MSSLKANLSRLNPAQLIDLADLVLSKIAPAAPATPPIPNLATKATALGTARDAAEAAHADYENARVTLANLKLLRDQKADLLRVEHAAVVAAVESECKGDAAKLASSGYPLAASASASVPAAQVKNLALTHGDDDGSLDVTFDPEPAARSYEVQVCLSAEPIAGPWNTKAQPTASKVTLDGLTSGSRVWVRVRAIAPAGPGPWSDVASKIVP